MHLCNQTTEIVIHNALNTSLYVKLITQQENNKLNVESCLDYNNTRIYGNFRVIQLL